VKLALENVRSIRSKPVWREPPGVSLESLPRCSVPLEQVVKHFEANILPFGAGNIHPRFSGWVNGAGNIYGALGESLAALINCNVGGRNHIGTNLEKEVIEWFKRFFAFSDGNSTGILTSGTSMGTLIALTVARNSKSPWDVQIDGLIGGPKRLIVYASATAHSCITKTVDIIGLGRSAVRPIAFDSNFRMDTVALVNAIEADLKMGHLPICVVSTVGSVDIGAIDDVAAVAAIARKYSLWHHVDGAFGAFAVSLPEYSYLLSSFALVDSIAFDMHKWLQVPYDAGCVLIRDGEAHRRAFALRRDYLKGDETGLAAGEPWFCDFGPELSRCFRALKVYFTVKVLGFDALEAVICSNRKSALHLRDKIVSSYPRLEVLAPVPLCIVCFRYRGSGDKHLDCVTVDRLNSDIVRALYDRGIAAPSTTKISGRIAIRCCIVNHRTTTEDCDKLAEEVDRIGQELELLIE